MLLPLQRVEFTFDDSQPQEGDKEQDDALDDDLLADYLSPESNKKAGKSSKQRSPSPLLFDLEVPAAAGTSKSPPAAGGRRGKRKAAAGAAAANGTDVQDPMRAAAMQQRALRQALAEATHAADDDGDDGIEILDSEGEVALLLHCGLLCSSWLLLCHSLQSRLWSMLKCAVLCCACCAGQLVLLLLFGWANT